jgi:hypothetical protein
MVHRPELLAYDLAAQQRFCAGDEIGCLARDLYGPGVLIGGCANLSAAVRETRAALATCGDITLFEATFRHRDVLVRGDILRRRRGITELIEVKSATRLKEYHLQDIAIQAWVMEGAGVTLDALKVAVVNPGFVYPGGGDYRGLLRETPVSDEARRIVALVPAWVRELSEMLAGPCPVRPTGGHCRTPYDCPFSAVCAGQVGDAVRTPSAEPAERGDPPWEGGAGGAAVAGFLAALPYPRYYLEFRTVQYSVPPWPGTRPYQHLVVQWSCQVEDAPGRLRRGEVQDAEGDSPWRAVAEALLGTLGDHGPIFVRTRSERLRLLEMAEGLPDLGPGLEQACARLVAVCDLVRDASGRPDAAETAEPRPSARTVALAPDGAGRRDVNDNAVGSGQAAYQQAGTVGASTVRRMHTARSPQEWISQHRPALSTLVHRLAGGPAGTPLSGRGSLERQVAPGTARACVRSEDV